MQLDIRLSPLLFPFVVPICVWLDIDLFHALGEALIFQWSNFIIIPLRILALIWVIEEGLASAFSLSIVGQLILAGSLQIMARCLKVLEKFGKSEIRIIQVYKELQIWIRYCNQNYVYFALPPVVFFGMCTLVFANYLTIRMPGRISWMIYWIAPGTSLAGFLLILMILPEASLVWDRSEILLGILKGRCYSKYAVRLCRSLAKVGMDVGPFGPFNKSWKALLVWNVANHSVNLLLTF